MEKEKSGGESANTMHEDKEQRTQEIWKGTHRRIAPVEMLMCFYTDTLFRLLAVILLQTLSSSLYNFYFLLPSPFLHGPLTSLDCFGVSMT